MEDNPISHQILSEEEKQKRLKDALARLRRQNTHANASASSSSNFKNDSKKPEKVRKHRYDFTRAGKTKIG